MGRLNQRQGFLVSAIAHVVLLSMLAARLDKPTALKTEPPSQEARAERVFMPPRAMLRQLLPQARPAPVPRPPQPQPPPAAKTKDRISVGAPSTERAKSLLLRREDDLTAVAKGRPDAVPSAPPPQPVTPPNPATADTKGTPDPGKGTGGLVLPRSNGGLARGDEGPLPGPKGRPLTASLERLEQQIGREGTRGLESGTGAKQMGPLLFDPEGADFTVWLNAFKNEVYRNWIVPQAASLGFRGHVDIEFTVERDGSMSSMRMLKSSGTPSLDRAAENALRGSRLLALPADYGPPRVTMQVTFFYNEGPRES